MQIENLYELQKQTIMRILTAMGFTRTQLRNITNDEERIMVREFVRQATFRYLSELENAHSINHPRDWQPDDRSPPTTSKGAEGVPRGETEERK